MFLLVLGIGFAFVGGTLAGLLATPATRGQASAPMPLLGRLTGAPAHRMNVLIMGHDVSYHGDPARSDTMIVASLSPRDGTIDLLSIPRDSKVAIPGHDIDKINAALAYGGPELAVQTVQQFLGVPINHYILANLKGLNRMVDLLGGVDLYVDRNMYYVDHTAGLYINLHKGYQHLDGRKAHEFIRFRHDVFGDITRVQRQQRFLRAVEAKLMQPATILRLPALIQALKQNVRTDLSDGQMLKWATWAKSVPKSKVKMVLMPGRFSGGPVSYWLVDQPTCQALAARLLTGRPLLPAATAVAPVASIPLVPIPSQQRADTQITVLNGTTHLGMAEQAASLLRTDGWTVWEVGNAPHADHLVTEIEAPAADDPRVAAIAHSLGIAPHISPTLTPTSSAFTVELGADFLHALRRIP